MSVAIIGGNECMVRQYIDLCSEYNCKAKVYPKMCTQLRNLGCPDLLILFTNTVAHNMIKSALIEKRRKCLKIARSHSSSIAALRKVLEEHVGSPAVA
ncbi:MAG: DUF2325 domain-containing protein [Thermoleophilia bacterium]|jgi:hypothetical protein